MPGNSFRWMGLDSLNTWVLSGKYFNVMPSNDLNAGDITGFDAIATVRSFLRGTVSIISGEIIIGARTSMQATLGRTEYRTVNFEQFYPFVRPSVQGCPIPMVDAAIRNSIIEFCEKSFIWKQESILNDIYEGEAKYTFSPPPEAKVVTPYRVMIYGKEIPPTDLETLETDYPNWRTVTSDLPYAYFMDTDRSVRLLGIPRKDLPDSLAAGVALKPTRDARGCPAFLFFDWAETIAAGALYRLLSMRGKIWANEPLAPMYYDQYRAGISRAKSKSSKSWQQSSKEMLAKRFYY